MLGPYLNLVLALSMSARYTCEIIFHRATNVPVGDCKDLSSDPYISATLEPLHNNTGGAPPLSYRTQTIRRTLNPTFDGRWLVSGVPAAGFVLTLWLLHEELFSRHDKLGKAVIPIPGPGAQLSQGWNSGEREYKVHKRYGSCKARLCPYVAKVVTRGRVRRRVRVHVSVRVLGPAPRLEPGDDAERVYTLGPHFFFRHFSPLAAALTSVRCFQAIQLQLTGPVPAALRLGYVGYRPFMKAMFRKQGIEGILLNRVLHKQHRTIYKWSRSTMYGVVEEQPGGCAEEKNMEGEDDEPDHPVHPVQRAGLWPDEAFARRFLELVEYGTEGRVFTYVIMLDGEWRFTETGEEFAIDQLSKHTMHSDVAPEVAFSGEFFVRRVRRSRRGPAHGRTNTNGDASLVESGSCDDLLLDDPAPASQAQSEEVEQDSDPSAGPPSAYELIIDNASGTYRGHNDLLPVLQAFLARPANLGALGRVRAFDRGDERLGRWKDRRREEKRATRGTSKGKEKAVPLVRLASVSSSGGDTAVGGDAEKGRAAGQEPV
ncbi:hypothetical protein LXA43DRAFT_86953 [Ganoderma leucocontextum]|nr:hypothetical protein LXA43DRAFT_86953 [Ganoderma leucocontextum]